MVLKRIFSKPKPAVPWTARAPDGVRIYAVGDIHGRRDLLDQLLSQIEADDDAREPATTQIIFLGDLADRGDDSAGVIDRLIALGAANDAVQFIFGNHEELLMRAWEGDPRAAGVFNRNGGRDTMLSYGIDPDVYDNASLEDLVAIIRRAIPRSHIEFLRSFRDWIVAGDYLFVHAGIRPGVPIEDQEVSDLRWIRGDFTRYQGAHDKMVIHGHSITEEVDDQPNRIGIDTGAFMSGKLTAIGIEGSERWFLQTGS
jgi:serine/threonine protein phosphatase 1